MVPPFNFISRRSTLDMVLSRKNLFSKFCKQYGKLDIVDIVKYLYLPRMHNTSGVYVIGACVHLCVCIYVCNPQKV